MIVIPGRTRYRRQVPEGSKANVCEQKKMHEYSEDAEQRHILRERSSENEELWLRCLVSRPNLHIIKPYLTQLGLNVEEPDFFFFLLGKKETL